MLIIYIYIIIQKVKMKYVFLLLKLLKFFTSNDIFFQIKFNFSKQKF